jgi:hypothetical protein
MRYPKMTIFFGVVLVLLAWLLISGIEGQAGSCRLGSAG